MSEYLTDKGIDPNTTPLDIHTKAQLLHDLALAPYMLKETCDQTVIPYSPNNKGWNRGKLVKFIPFTEYNITISSHQFF